MTESIHWRSAGELLPGKIWFFAKKKQKTVNNKQLLNRTIKQSSCENQPFHFDLEKANFNLIVWQQIASKNNKAKNSSIRLRLAWVRPPLPHTGGSDLAWCKSVREEEVESANST